MRWTLRLKRHGGLRGLEAKRSAQIRRLAELGRLFVGSAFRFEGLTASEWVKAGLYYLHHHPLRVMPEHDRLLLEWIAEEVTHATQPSPGESHDEHEHAPD